MQLYQVINTIVTWLEDQIYKVKIGRQLERGSLNEPSGLRHARYGSQNLTNSIGPRV